jgi:hypothetical protein
MSEFHIGDRVVSIDTAHVPPGTEATILDIAPNWGWCPDGHEPGEVLILTVDHGECSCGWCPHHWRVIHSPGAEFIASLKKNVPKTEDA